MQSLYLHTEESRFSRHQQVKHASNTEAVVVVYTRLFGFSGIVLYALICESVSARSKVSSPLHDFFPTVLRCESYRMMYVVEINQG